MGVIATDHGMVSLPSRALIGRSSSCTLKFEDRTVSGEHAVLAYVKGKWSVRDLGSRNGTRVNGVSLRSGDRVEVSAGAMIECGSVALKLLSDGAPGPAVVAANGDVIEANGGVLPLSRGESPSAVLVQSNSGWMLESADGVRAVEDGEVVTFDGDEWTIFVPLDEGLDVRSTVQPMDTPMLLGRITIEFQVSRDEEFVELVLKNTEHRISARAANYLLLILARERLADAALAEADRGWVYSSELAKKLSFDLERLNVEVFRARAALAAVGVVDASRIIERRAVTRQLRIGTERIVLPAAIIPQ